MWQLVGLTRHLRWLLVYQITSGSWKKSSHSWGTMMRIRNWLHLATVVCFLAACESDEKKLQRLQGDQAMYCLNAQAHYREFEAVRYPGGMTAKNPRGIPSHKADSLRGIWYEYKTKCELATRDLNRFMH